MKTTTTLFALSLVACGGKVAEKPIPPAAEVTYTDPSNPADPNASDPTRHEAMAATTPSDLKWLPLDPAAGDKGPMVASLWGDMQSEPAGFFIKLPAGNPGTLHTHASDYHAVAISGSTSNAQDGTRKPLPLTAPAYWYQPGGLAHTTACANGADCIALVHFVGKFDFAPAQPAKGAKPDPRYVEKRGKELTWKPLDASKPKGVASAQLWGDATSQPNGFFLRIPAGEPPFWHIHKHDYHGVVLAGTIEAQESGKDPKELPTGSYWWQPGGYKHTTNCKAGTDCVVYLYFTGKFDFVPAQ